MLPLKIFIFALNVIVFILSLIDDSFRPWTRLLAFPSVFILVALHRLEVRKKAGKDLGLCLEDIAVLLLGVFNVFDLFFKLRDMFN